MSEKHTATPWRLSKKYPARIVGVRKGHAFVADCDSDVDEEVEDQANAEFIVRACNAYDKDQETIADLVKALQGMLQYFNDGIVPAAYRGEPAAFDIATNKIAEARAALAKAQQDIDPRFAAAHYGHDLIAT